MVARSARPRALRQTVAEVIGKAAGEDLRLVLQTAKGARMDHAIAVTLVVVAIGMRRFGIASAARLLDSHGIIGEHCSVYSCELLVASRQYRNKAMG